MNTLATLALIMSLSNAPDFTLKSLDGHTVHLSDFRGKVVVLNFWATWCAGCRVEIPRLIDAERRYGAADFVVVGVSMDDAGDDVVARFAKAMNVNYTVVRGDAAVARAYGGVRFLPQSFMIDRHGKLVKMFAGPPDSRELHRLIEPLLQKR
jgi:peroxiredoxin